MSRPHPIIAATRRHFEQSFEAAFNAPLSQYWDDNLGGFQMTPFCTQILEYRGPHPMPVCGQKFGVAGVNVIRDILAQMTEIWTR